LLALTFPRAESRFIDPNRSRAAPMLLRGGSFTLQDYAPFTADLPSPSPLRERPQRASGPLHTLLAEIKGRSLALDHFIDHLRQSNSIVTFMVIWGQTLCVQKPSPCVVQPLALQLCFYSYHTHYSKRNISGKRESHSSRLEQLHDWMGDSVARCRRLANLD
jgi:hypothetical protein